MFRLKSVYIKDYKNIHEQTFDFSTNTGYIALIGLNGSGKSNLLEAIALIFEGILFTHRAVNFHYEIKYEIGNVEYIRRNRFASRDGARISERDMVYPTSIIACYSGEDRRLWHTAFEKYYMQYFKKAVRNRTFSPQIMYIDKYCWKIAFIALLCSNNADILQFLRECCHFNNIDEISIKFNTDQAKERTFIHHAASRWYHALEQNADAYGNINANTIVSTDMTTYGARNSVAPNYIFQFLYLLALPKKNKEKRQTIDKLITDIGIEINGLNFDGLSEGEKKMILVTCITQILGNDNSLVLLDEPDAHVHIENKKEILKTIEQYNGQTIFTTHSPIMSNLVGDANNIKLMKDGQFTNTSKLEQLKRLSGNELQYFEGAFVLSRKNILVTEGIYDIRYLRKAIEIFAQRDNKYKKLKEIGMLYAGSASEADIIYNELLNSNMNNLDKVVFLFDYDKGGLDGWKKVNPIASTEPKVDAIFYQHDYSITLNTATDKVDQQDSIIVEDMFGEAAYSSLFVNPAIMTATHKYFRCRQKITDKIKEYLQKNYDTIDKHDYDKYEPLLEKLLELYNF